MADRSGTPPPPEPGEPQRGPRLAPQTLADKAARQARLAAELRRNLQKRKRQQQARAGRPPQDG